MPKGKLRFIVNKMSMIKVAGVLQDKLPQLKSARKVFLAFSGGLDSTVLFQLLVQARISFTAIHINHQLSANADAWQQFCEQLAKEHSVPLLVYKVKVENQGRGLEDAARAARFSIFDRSLEKGDVLLTAHHADDQAETFLFRLMRGAGLKGLAAIQSERELGKGTILRPLLHVPRGRIQAYAEQYNLHWVEDESNQHEEFDRNYIRKQLLPVLRHRWPSAVSQITSTAELISKDSDLLREFAAMDYQRCSPQIERQGESLRIDILEGFSQARVHNVLRYWLYRQGYTAASTNQLPQIEGLLHARLDAAPEVLTKNWCFRRFGRRVYLLPPPTARRIQSRVWDTRETITFENGASLSLIHGAQTRFSVKVREGGERCRPFGRDHSQALKKLLQEYHLEPWWRDVVPLVFLGDKLVAVGDLFVCEPDVGYRFKWTFPDESVPRNEHQI